MANKREPRLEGFDDAKPQNTSLSRPLDGAKETALQQTARPESEPELKREKDGDLTPGANRNARDVSGQFKFKQYTTVDGSSVKEASGWLGEPGRVQKHGKSNSFSEGDDAGHLIGERFGAPGGEENLGEQNWRQNRFGTYKQMENDWDKKRRGGTEIFVRVQEHTKPDETRAFKREVTWIEQAPDGTRNEKSLTFGNMHTPESRVGHDVESTMPDKSEVLQMSDYESMRRQKQGGHRTPKLEGFDIPKLESDHSISKAVGGTEEADGQIASAATQPASSTFANVARKNGEEKDEPLKAADERPNRSSGGRVPDHSSATASDGGLTPAERRALKDAMRSKSGRAVREGPAPEEGRSR